MGHRLGKILINHDMIALVGDLGSGKTWFTKGLALGLGVSPDTVITSPSFALVNEYEGQYPFFHMDVYRLESLSAFFLAGLDDYLHMDGIVAMEWADRWPHILPDQRIKVELKIGSETARDITISGHHPRALEILEQMNKSQTR